MNNIGENIKAVMEKKEVDAHLLSRLTGIDVEVIQGLIDGKVEPMVSDILKIANVLGVDTSTLFFGRAFEDRRATKVSPDERVKVKRRDGLKYESLAPYYIGKHMEPFAIEVYSNENPKISKHSGEEFCYVLEGKLKITVGDEEFVLSPEDSLYFDSSFPHSITSLGGVSKAIAVIYNPGSMVHVARSGKMRDIIQAAKMLEKRSISLVCPDDLSLSAVNKAIEEGIIDKVYLVGARDKIGTMCSNSLIFKNNYIYEYIEKKDEEYEPSCAKRGVALIREGKAQMLMKGKINSVFFMKAVLDKKEGIGTERRLSLVSIFELPNLNRLIFLTDPAINPEPFKDKTLKTAIDIIKNAIDVAKSLGVVRPKVALLDANEMPSESIPTTIYEKKLSEMEWEDADVYGPLSYDLALYEDAVKIKGLKDNPVAGKADILVVPHIDSGNFLYKAWVYTMGAEVANIVLGAKVPIIFTSRSDSEIIKFLTICASAIYSDYLEKTKKT